MNVLQMWDTGVEICCAVHIFCAANAERSKDFGSPCPNVLNILKVWDTGVEIWCTVYDFALKMLNVLGISGLHVQR